MASNSKELEIATGLRKIDDKYFDYLFSLKDLYNKEEVLSFRKFIVELKEGENLHLIFNTIKGINLKSEIKREINDLYSLVYKGNYS